MLFFDWRDLCEISFFSLTIYWFCIWLKKDTRHNLLPAFYGYSLLLFGAHLLKLSTLLTFLFATSPIAIMLFILFHQELLQRNFITFRKKSIDITTHNEWIEALIRSCLVSINNSKELLFIIESKDELKPFLSTPFLLNTAIQDTLLEFLIKNPHFDSEKMVWINAQGDLVAIHASWKFNIHESWQSEKVKELPSWQQDALLMTLKTDSIIGKADPTKRLFDVVIQGKLYESISAQSALLFIKKQISKSEISKGDHYYDAHNQKQPTQQQNN